MWGSSTDCRRGAACAWDGGAAWSFILCGKGLSCWCTLSSASPFSCFSERCWTKLRIIARGFCRQLLKTSVCGSSKCARWRRFTTPWTCATSTWPRNAWLLKCGVLLLTSIPSSLLSGGALWVAAVSELRGFIAFSVLGASERHPLGLLESALSEDSVFSMQEWWLRDKSRKK